MNIAVAHLWGAECVYFVSPSLQINSRHSAAQSWMHKMHTLIELGPQPPVGHRLNQSTVQTLLKGHKPHSALLVIQLTARSSERSPRDDAIIGPIN